MSTFLTLFAALLMGAVLGAGGFALLLRYKAKASMQLPDQWLLTSRVLMSSEEHEVFKWLSTVFHDHLVMVKVPVLRFTLPTEKDKNSAEHWQTLLGGVYCTFTVCTPNGNVVGCVDVPGKRGLKKGNREVKESLLSDCRIAYTVVRSVQMPKTIAMRAAFLGEMEQEDHPKTLPPVGNDSAFFKELNEFTNERRLAAKAAALKQLNTNDALKPIPNYSSAGFNPDGSGAAGSDMPSRLPSQWSDSFIQPDESRRAKLG